ncbi:MAG: S49 family peptidase [Actinomycetota bacterium]|nr:S49 family peptidase [Actinomycetota bacterium]
MIDRSVISSYIPAFISIINGTYNPGEPKNYHEEKVLPFLEQMGSRISITADYENPDIPENSIAVHPIFGVVRAESRWNFATKQFVRNVMAAENNPAIIAHFIPASTPGGEAHYLDQAAAVLESTQKPVVVHFERMIASAGVYLTAPANRIYANSRYDRAGSIGTMVSGVDMVPLLEMFGAKYFEAFATDSTLKNKIETELMNGNPEGYISQVLDPLNEGFLDTVKRNRPGVNSASKDAGVLNGNMFYAPEAIKHGLIDGIKSQAQALSEAYDLGIEHRKMQSKTRQIQSFLYS